MLGRVLADDEDQVDTQAPVVLISERFWRRPFGADPNIVGKAVRMNGVPITIIGVMPEHLYLWNERADFWGPIQFNRSAVRSAGFGMSVVARLKPGVDIRAAQAKLDAIAAQQRAADPGRNEGVGVEVQPMAEGCTETYSRRSSLWREPWGSSS
jgi:hypothetical protein